MLYTQAQVDRAVEQGLGMGWANYSDSTYTLASPLVIANSKVQITNDTLSSQTNIANLPEGITTFWDTVNNEFIAGQVNDAFDVRLSFKAKSSLKDGIFDVTFDIGDGVETIIFGSTQRASKEALTEMRYAVDPPTYALSQFLTNGCKMYIDTSIDGSTLSVYDISIMIKRDYARA